MPGRTPTRSTACDYFPKWLCAVPYSPVTGPRLLARDDAARRALLDAIVALRAATPAGPRRTSISIAEAEAAAFDARWLAAHRRAVPLAQRRRLARLRRLPRRDGPQAPQEHPPGTRARSPAPASRFRIVHGDEASDDDLAAMHGFYLQTFARVRQHAGADAGVLPPPGARRCRAQLVLVLAERDGEHDRRRAVPARRRHAVRTLLGRQRAAARPAFRDLLLPGHRLLPARRPARFEPGAQGEHKIARGFLPALVHSRHWIADPGLRRRDRAPGARRKPRRCAATRRALAAHSPFRGERRMSHARCPALLDDDAVRRSRRPSDALREPDGLLAVGGDLSPPRLLNAYRHGIFPWYSRGPTDPVVVARIRAWCSAPTACACRRASGAGCAQSPWHVRADTRLRRGHRRLRAAFRAPASAAPGSRRRCARPTASCTGSGMRTASRCSTGERLVGGIYGVAIGRMFFGESMFSARIRRLQGGARRPRPPPARVGLAADRRAGRERRTCVSLGAEALPRREFLAQVARAGGAPEPPGPWTDALRRPCTRATSPA